LSLRPALLATATLLALATSAQAQETPLVPRDGGDIVQPGDLIGFEADEMTYDDKAEIITASGSVRLNRDAWRLSADRIEYNRATGIVVAVGHVIVTDPEGNQALGERVELTDSLRDGVIDNVLLVLNDGGRLAAVEGARTDDVISMRRAVYSPCAVVDKQGCPHAPVWQL
jgi:LPS-assembly protein